VKLLSLLGLGKAPPSINTSLQMISKRAERLDPKEQAATFVSLGALEHALLNPDNRIIFGRRGTGKTHVMSFVADQAAKKREMACVIDLRTIGSNSYIYGDDAVPLAERATRLLRDFIAALHNGFLEQVTDPKGRYPVDRLSPMIDKLGVAIREVLVRDTVERKTAEKTGSKTTLGGNAEGALSPTPSLKVGGKGEHERSGDHSAEVVEKAHPRLSVNIGQVHRALNDFADRVGGRIWVLIDEWSTVPEVLQPYLADFIKRTLFPNRNYSVHIAAIEQRSNFRQGMGGASIGMELGSDASADVNLDDYLVFENSPFRSVAFFREMLFKHLLSVRDGAGPKSGNDFVRAAFTQEQAFTELVRASEGVPRDAINILQIAATRAREEKVSIPHIRNAAKDWYERDKATFVSSNPEAERLLNWIIEKVIGARKARAFLVRSGVQDEALDRLFDDRILHIAKKAYSTKQEPGVRYKVWKLDYGCYVDLINTARQPTGFLFENAEVTDDGTCPCRRKTFGRLGAQFLT